MKEQRKKSKQLRKDGLYAEAVNIYRQLWEVRGQEWDIWLGWEYADSLKKIGEVDKAISICKITYLRDKAFKYNNDLVCWCLFEKNIKCFDSNISSEVSKFIEIATFIVDNTVHDGKRTAYEATVFKVLKVLQHQNNLRYEEVLKWVNKLNYKLLSEEVTEFQLNDGKTKEGASRKEQYFQIKTKALQKTNRYAECIESCNIAFNEITSFHYDNQIWFEVRKQYCICVSNKFDIAYSAAQQIVKLAEQKRHWSIFSEAFRCFYYLKDYQQAIACASKALLSKDPLEKKVGLLFQVGSLLEFLNETEKAKRYLYLVYFIRREKGWTISQELEDKLNTYGIQIADYCVGKLKKDLKNEWISNIKENQVTLEGVISNIVLPRRKSGFIKRGEESYFFNISSIVNGHSKLRVGAKVLFTTVDTIHPVSKLSVKNAVNIEVM